MNSPAPKPSVFNTGQSPVGQIVQPPNVLRGRLGPRIARIDPDAIAKAEAALKSLSSQFGQWLNDEVSKLEAAHAAVRGQGLTRETGAQVYTHAHDLKGLGATYEFPLVTRLAASLCKLLGDGAISPTVPVALVDAHVAAIRAAVRDNIRDANCPMGEALSQALEQRVREYLATEPVIVRS